MTKTTSTKIILSFFMILILALTGFSKTKTVTSSWLSSPLNIDGLSGDWEDAVLSFEKKLSVNYAFMNDAENLFVLFIFKDPKYLSSIKETGMTLWFNTEGKKKKNYGLTFLRKKILANDYISYLEQQKGPIPEEKKKKILANRSYSLHSIHIINKKNKPSSLPSESGEIKTALFRTKNQNKMTVYELVIPLKRLAENVPGIGTEPGKTLKVGFEWGGMTEEMRKRMIQKQVGSGRRSSGVADSGRGVLSEGRGGSSTPKTSRNPKKRSFWVDIHLAQNK